MEIKKWLDENFEKNHFVLITGSTSGIGHEYAKRFASLGCNLICVSNEGEKLLQDKLMFEGSYKIVVENINVDLCDTKATVSAVNSISEKKIGVLINNAGFGLKGKFETHSAQDYLDIIAVNVSAPVLFCRAVLPQMQASGTGLIIHVASINAIVPIPNNQVYTATKAFCASYASAVARENKDNRILFQLVLPGTTKTPFHDRQGANPKNLVMMPEDVVGSSLENVSREVCIPNKADRLLPYLIPILPRNAAMDLASYMLKKRLGM